MSRKPRRSRAPVMSSDDHRPRRVMTIRRIGFLAVALALAYAPAAFGADPPKGSHGQETDAPAATTAAAYARAVAQVCAHARLFEQSHSIATRAGALAVAGDIRASTQ